MLDLSQVSLLAEQAGHRRDVLQVMWSSELRGVPPQCSTSKMTGRISKVELLNNRQVLHEKNS